MASSGLGSSEQDLRKRRARDWDERAMNAEVFDTPEVTAFVPYAAVSGRARGGGGATAQEDAHFFNKGNMELDDSTVAPSQAFEAFMGKIYRPTTATTSTGVLPSTQTEFEASGSSAPASTGASILAGAKPLESPLQRFTRLAMEVKELEADLQLLAASAEDKKHGLRVDAAQDAEFSEILQGLATLQLNLSAMEQNAGYQPFLRPGIGGTNSAAHTDAITAVQRDLTARFFQQIENLKRQQREHGAPTSDTSAPIVYEIYSNGELNAVDRDAKSRMVALEARLAAMERIVGATHPRELHVDGLRVSAGNNDLASIVEELEQRVNLLNEKNLDTIKTRTTALVHEFTLLHKIKESPSVQSALNSQADREKIQQIYEKMTSVEETAASVPALVDRLASLKALHDDSVDMSTRVKTLEQSQEALNDLLESDAEMLTNIEKSLQENVQIFQSNIQLLDERMNALLRGQQ